MKSADQYPYRVQKVHNQSTLHEYDLFATGQGEFVRQAFMKKPGVIEIIQGHHDLSQFLNEIRLAVINYEDYNPETEEFSLIISEIKDIEISDQIILVAEDYQDEKNYMILFRNERVPVILDPEIGGILDTHYNAFDSSDFGVRLYDNKAVFKLWSPPAGRVDLLLFSPEGNRIFSPEPIFLKKGEKGVWMTEINSGTHGSKDLDELMYQYRVFAYGKVFIAADPFAFSMGAFNPSGNDKIGKSVVVNMNSNKAKPAGFRNTYSNKTAMANACDLIVWEGHVRDFTIQLEDVSSELSGTYLGFAQQAPYLKELGITHVQLMPVMKFYTVNENDRSFSGIDRTDVNYNWGYDPMSYFAPEGWFSTDATDPYKRISELRTLIQTLHDLGIGVILDVVYNHTHIVETLENVAPGCYYRLNEKYKISGHTGAGPSLESRRPMVRKLIVESLCHYIQEYYVDGFRFDLMGFTDHETLRMIRNIAGRAYDHDDLDALILQGEAWVFSDLDTNTDSNDVHAAVTKLNYPEELTQLGIFNDTARDSICGKNMEEGFIHGNTKTIPEVASVIVGGVKSMNPGSVPFHNNTFRNPYVLFANSVANCINFLSVHDGLTLWDKLRLSTQGMSVKDRVLMMKMASLILFTSAGKVILHGGDEILRSKPVSMHDWEKNRTYAAPETEAVDGVHTFHENSYCSGDFTNMIRWDRLANDPNAMEMHDYYKGLILMRRSLPAFRSEPCKPAGSHLRFLTLNSNIQNEVPSFFQSFDDPQLNALTIRFKNGPALKQYYVAGEVHAKNRSDNPEQNPFYVVFDEKGFAEIAFDKNHIHEFDLSKWGTPDHLNIKLVSQQGSWESIPGAYSEFGSNSIDARVLDQFGCVTVDLSRKNDAAVSPDYEYDHFIAFLMDNDPNLQVAPGYSNLQVDKVLVIHNPSDQKVVLNIPELETTEQWDVIADVRQAGISPLEYTGGGVPIQVYRGKIIVFPKNSFVIVRRKRM